MYQTPDNRALEFATQLRTRDESHIPLTREDSAMSVIKTVSMSSGIDHH